MSEIVGIGEQHLERAEAEQLVEDVADQRLALELAERSRAPLFLEHRRDDAADLGLGLGALDPREPIEVQPVQQRLVDCAP